MATAKLDHRGLVFGRARPGIAAMVARRGKTVYRAKTGPGGAFLFVLDDTSFTSLKVSPAR